MHEAVKAYLHQRTDEAVKVIRTLPIADQLLLMRYITFAEPLAAQSPGFVRWCVDNADALVPPH